MSEEPGVKLLDFVKGLRKAIEESQSALAKSKKKAMFKVKEVEAEIQFVVEKEIGGEAGGNILFVALGAKGAYKSQNVHTLKLTLSPVGPVEVAGPESGPAPREAM